jgi:hypothetical protein
VRLRGGSTFLKRHLLWLGINIFLVCLREVMGALLHPLPCWFVNIYPTLTCVAPFYFSTLRNATFLLLFDKRLASPRFRFWSVTSQAPSRVVCDGHV